MRMNLRGRIACGLLLLLVAVVAAKAQTVQYGFPVFVNGGRVLRLGDLRYASFFNVTNLSTVDAQVTFRFFDQNGQPYSVGLTTGALEDQAGQLERVEAGSVQTITVPANRTLNLPLTTVDQVTIFSALVTTTATVLINGEYMLFSSSPDSTASNIKEQFYSSAPFAGTDSFLGQRFLVFPAFLGKTNFNSQREVVISVFNPNTAIAVRATITLLANDNSIAGTLNVTVPPQGQTSRLLSLIDFPGIRLDGKIRVITDADAYVGAVQFRNAAFTSVKVQKDMPPPIVGIDSPNEGSILSPNLLINGWVGIQDLTESLDHADISLDSGAFVAVPLTVDRPDVPQVFPGVQVKCGFSYSLTNLTAGAHSIRVRATNKVGIFVEMVRNVTVNAPAIAFLSGRYVGDVDLTKSTGVTRANFILDIISNNDGNGSTLTSSSVSLTMNCAGTTVQTGFNFGQIAITQDVFEKTDDRTFNGSACHSFLHGVFDSPNSISLTHSFTGGNCWGVAPTTCPAINLVAKLIKQ